MSFPCWRSPVYETANYRPITNLWTFSKILWTTCVQPSATTRLSVRQLLLFQGSLRNWYSSKWHSNSRWWGQVHSFTGTGHVSSTRSGWYRLCRIVARTSLFGVERSDTFTCLIKQSNLPGLANFVTISTMFLWWMCTGWLGRLQTTFARHRRWAN